MSDYIFDSLASHLKNDAGVTAQLSSADDIYLDVAEPNHGPEYITISALPMGENMRHQEGESGLRLQDFQVNAWSDRDSIKAAALANAIRLSLNLLAAGGTLGTAPNNITVKSAFIEEPPDSAHIPSRTGGVVGTFGARQTVSIWAAITVPS